MLFLPARLRRRARHFFFLFRYLCLSFFDYRTYTTRAIVTCCVFCLIFNNYGTRSRGTGRRLGNNSSFSRGDVMCAGELSRLPLFLFYRFCIVYSFFFFFFLFSPIRLLRLPFFLSLFHVQWKSNPRRTAGCTGEKLVASESFHDYHHEGSRRCALLLVFIYVLLLLLTFSYFW